MRLDGMDPVAIRTHRSLPVSSRHSLSVNALLKFLGDGVVALPASCGHVELEDRRLLTFSIENFVGAMTICADRSLFRTRGHRVSMDTLLVGRDHVRALPAVGHYQILAVAGTAGSGNI